MIKKNLCLLMLLFCFNNHETQYDIFNDFSARLSKSGYYFSFNIVNKSPKNRKIQYIIDDLIVEENNAIYEGECNFLLKKSTGLLNFSGYKDLVINYIENSELIFSDRITFMGFKNSAVYSEDNNYEINYVYHKGQPILVDYFEIEENEECIIPRGINTYINDIFSIDCNESAINFISTDLQIDEKNIKLELNYNWIDMKYCLNCPEIRIDRNPGLIDCNLVINYDRFFQYSVYFHVTLLVKNIFSNYTNTNYSIIFGVENV